MKKTVLLLMALCYVSILLIAAPIGRVFGILRDKTDNTPIEFATIALYETSSQKLITGTTTDSTGHFFIDAVSQGNYYVICSFIGLDDLKTDSFQIEEKSHIVDLGTLIMGGSQQLNEVVVEGRKSTFVQKLDKRVFNVGEDITSSSGSAGDLMQNIPSVEVDMEGTVTLRGNENVTILINGKPSALMSAKTRADALQQLSATSIERIEVITNPSAQFKPDGVSGIINIVMKKETKSGLNGGVSANTGNYDRYNAGINLNYGMRRINIFGGYAFRQDRYDRSIFDDRTSANGYIKQKTLGTGHPVTHSFRLGASLDYSENDNIEVAGSYNHRKFIRWENLQSKSFDTDHNLTDSYLRKRDADADENMWEASFKYTHTYGEEKEWGIDYTYSSESEDEQNKYITQEGITTVNTSRNNEQVWDANYIHLGKLYWQHRFSSNYKLDAGYELEVFTAEQNYHVQDWNGTAFIVNKDRTCDFTHQCILNSVYATLEILSGKWSFMTGVRGEYADLENRLYTSDTVVGQYYTNIYPTLHASRQIDENNELQMNYSLRCNRPDGEDMNPFSEQINPLSLSAGNPNLKPEKIHSLEAGWLWHNDRNSTLMTTLYYRYHTNKVTEVSRYITGGVLLTTKENLESSHDAGLEIIWSYSLGKWLSFNWNANGFYNQIDAQKLGYGKHKSTYSWSTLVNANILPFKHYMIQLNARYRSSTLVPQGKRDPDCRINIGMKYDMPKLNLSLLASVSDLFDTYRKSYTLDTPDLKQKVEKRKNPRIFYVGLSYTFGRNTGKKQDAKLEFDENL